MKPRRWLLVLLLLPTLLLLGASLLWHTLDLGEVLRQKSIESLEASGFKSLRIESIRPTFRGLEITDLHLQEKNAHFSLSCPSALLKLSPLAWFLNQEDPLAFVYLIELHQPRLDLSTSLLLANAAPLADSTQTTKDFSSFFQPSQLEHLRHPEIRIRDAQIFLDQSGDSSLTQGHLFADRLSGLLTEQDDLHFLLLQSQLFDGGGGLNLRLQADPRHSSLGFSLDLDSLLVQHTLMPESFALESGRLVSDLHVGGRFLAGKLDSLQGEGRLWVPSAKSEHWPGEFEVLVPINFDLEGWRIPQGELKGRGLHLPFSMSSDLAFAKATCSVDSARLDLGVLANLLDFLPDSLSAACLLEAGLDFERGQPLRMDMHLQTDLIQLGAMPLATVQLGATLQEGKVLLQEVQCRLPSGELMQGEGEVLGKSLSLDLLTQVHLTHYAQGIVKPQSEIFLRLRPSLDWENSDFLAYLDLDADLMEPSAPTLRASGHFDLSGGVLEFWQIQPEARTDLRFGEIALNYAGLQPDWRVDIENLAPLYPFLKESIRPSQRIRLEMEGQSRWAALRASTQLAGLPLHFEGQVTWLPNRVELDSDWQLNGHRGESLMGRLEGYWSHNRLVIERFLFLDHLEATASIDFAHQQYALDLNAESLPLSPIWNAISEDLPRFDLGQLDLWLTGQGPLDQFAFQGGLELQQPLAGRSAHLQSELSYSQDRLQFEQTRVMWDAQDLLLASAEIRPSEQSLNASFEFFPQDLKTWLDSENAKWAGELQGAGEFRSDSSGMHLTLNAAIHDPVFAGRAFDACVLAISPRQGASYLDSLVLRREGKAPWYLQVAGALPGSESEMALFLDLHGDLLEPLSFTSLGKKSKFFVKAHGMGQLEATLRGTWLDPVLADAHLELHQAEMNLQSIVRRVRDLEVEARVENGRLFLEHCEGRVPRGRIRVRNRWGVMRDGEELESLRLDRPDLDCGVFILETLDRHNKPAAIELNIPGLMRPDWDARVLLGGVTPDEDFYFAGPLHRPLIRGHVDLSHTRFTFPFLKSKEKPTPLLRKTIAFLNSMEWDLSLDAGRNCNYFKRLQGFEDTPIFSRMKGFLDRIVVDVFLEPTQKALRMQGQIDDQSFEILGDIACSRGSVVFLEKDFEVEEAGMTFDASSLYPVVWGRAVHHIFDPTGQTSFSTLLTQDARQIYIQFLLEDELGNRITRGRWNEVHLELLEDPSRAASGILRGQEELLGDMGLDPLDPSQAIEDVLPGMVAGFWEIPLQPIESRLRRDLRLDVVRIFLPVLRNTAEELLSTQNRQATVSQSYLNYLQGSRVVLGKGLGEKTFVTWAGQLMTASALDEKNDVRFYQRFTLEYEVSRSLTLTGELVYDPLRDDTRWKGDPRVMVSYRLKY
jgi:hypothetical protein